MNRVRAWCEWLSLRQKLIWALALLVLGAHPWLTKADSTFVYAVQLSAVVQTNPPQIKLNWEPDPIWCDELRCLPQKQDGPFLGRTAGNLARGFDQFHRHGRNFAKHL